MLPPPDLPRSRCRRPRCRRAAACPADRDTAVAPPLGCPTRSCPSGRSVPGATAPNSTPRSDGLIGEASTATATSLTPAPEPYARPAPASARRWTRSWIAGSSTGGTCVGNRHKEPFESDISAYRARAQTLDAQADAGTTEGHDAGTRHRRAEIYAPIAPAGLTYASPKTGRWAVPFVAIPIAGSRRLDRGSDHGREAAAPGDATNRRRVLVQACQSGGDTCQ